MNNFEHIKNKLEAFIRKYYTNELLKGVILFLSIGLLYFLITLLIEYFLWLGTGGRKILFLSFIAVEFFLFIRFIIFPISQLFKFRKGINYEDASRIIGNHFPEVNDKLLNVLQLSNQPDQNELLLAGINQKSQELSPIPFQNAIQFKKNAKYLKYLAIPVFIYLAFTLMEDENPFSTSYERMVNYDVAYEPPAPFSFIIENESLQAIENKPFTIKVKTEGNIIPEVSSIQFNGESYFMQNEELGVFTYTFQQPITNFNFNFHSNKVYSKPYTLEVLPTPNLLDFDMELYYPAHTHKSNETIKSGGNASVPEGTKVNWIVKTKNTDEVVLKTPDTSFLFNKNKETFDFSKQLFSHFNYAISSSNKHLKDYENLSFSLNVIKDQYPEIDVQSKRDSLDLERVLFFGNVSDDYGLYKLQLVYFPVGDESILKRENISISKGSYDQFTFEFPGNLDLEEGVSYEYYFEVFDNDAINNFKSTKSSTFTFRKLTSEEIETQQLENQRETIQGMDKSLQDLKNDKELLDELSRMQKEKQELNYNDRKKLENFLKRQKQQEEMMKSFSEKLKEELKNFQPEKENDSFKEQLENRIEENEQRLEHMEDLLKELERLQDKIEKEDLSEKLEKLGKERKNQERNLEQLVELTKRYYVERKAEKLAEDLMKLGEKQEKLANESEEKNTKEAQDELNNAFDKIKEELDELRKENEELKNPLDILDDPGAEDEIDKDQKDATDKLEQNKSDEAAPSQQDAGQKMKQMAKMMMDQMAGGQMQTLNEDVEMLRQILSNLIVFSFEQEDLMNSFKDIRFGNPLFGRKLVVQNELKQNFEHVDDSLFALSLRQPTIGDEINAILTETHFNIDKSLERLAENQISQGTANQQYIMKGANDLAVLLDDILSNMQMQLQMSGEGDGEGMPSQGEGQGRGFQLPDIIQQQESLMGEMEKGMEEGDNDGDSGEDGSQGGESGKDGEGNQGDGQGNQGKSGKGNQGQGDNSQEGSDGEEGWSEQLYEIYKQQQKLRQELESKLREAGLPGNSERILKDMEGIEQRLLERGFDRNVLQDMRKLKYELLKLDEAFFQQGQEEKREANTNRREFENRLRMSSEEIRKYFNTTEILNRDALPLREDYRIKVNSYFRNENDGI